MNKTVVISMLFLFFKYKSLGQCENKRDSLGRKQGHWCFNQYEYDYLKDSISFKYKEGRYDSDEPTGKWYFYMKGSDVIPYSVIEYFKDSGIVDNNVCFISKDSLYLVNIYKEDGYKVECKFDSLAHKYICSKRYSNIYFYVKEVNTFKEAERSIRYRWIEPYHLITNRKKILVTDSTKLSRNYKLP